MASILPWAIADEAPARRNTLLWTAALVPLLSAYCLAHDLLGKHPTLSMEPLAWSVASLLPWAVAFELIQRVRSSPRLTGRRRDAAVVSIMLLAYLVAIPEMRGFKLTAFGDRTDWAVEALQRLPYLAALIAVLAATGAIQRWQRLAQASGRPREAMPDCRSLPAPGDVLWARAAGNYVEFCIGGRTLLHRATLQSVEQYFASAEFLRIHRSTIVNRRKVTRTVTDASRLYLVTEDGQRHPVSAAFRSRVEAAVTPFVPSSLSPSLRNRALGPFPPSGHRLR